MGRPAIDRRCSHLPAHRAEQDAARGRSSGVDKFSGRGGSTVFRVGPDFGEPAVAPAEDAEGTRQLLEQLERQQRARSGT